MNSDATPLILASASPRRLELLQQIGISPLVMPADIDESLIRTPDPLELVSRLAMEKHTTVARRVVRADDRRLCDHWILAADTVVSCEGVILEKPATPEEAAEMLRHLSGREHQVVTGLVLCLATDTPTVRTAVTDVAFCTLTEEEIAWYVGTGEWHDVSGAYRIQGRAARYIEGIHGSHSNVVGLPLHLVYSILRG